MACFMSLFESQRGEIPLCDDWDAYYTNKAFFDSIDNYGRIMEQAKEKSLGLEMSSGAALLLSVSCLVICPNW